MTYRGIPAVIFGIKILLFLLINDFQGMETLEYHLVEYHGRDTVEEGDPVTMECRFSAFSGRLKWMKDGVVVDRSDENIRIGEYQESEGHKIYSNLTIMHASTRHSGSYRCNSFSRAFHHLSVIPLPNKKMEIKPKPPYSFTTILTPGETIVLECDFSEIQLRRHTTFPVTWYKSLDGLSQPIITDNKDSKFETVDNILRIKNAQYHDAAEYFCTLEDLIRKGQGASKAFVIKSKPKIRPYLGESDFISGDNLQLQCLAEGYPLPQLRWYIGNIPVSEPQKTGHNVSVTLSKNGKGYPSLHLQITNVTKKDFNLYTCVAKNSVGQDEASILVRIRVIIANSAFLGTNAATKGDNAIITNADEFNNLAYTVGKNFYLYCNVTDNSEVQVVWYKDGQILNQTSKIIIHKNNTLFFKRATLEEVGAYTCLVPRDSPNEIINATIYVWSRPVVTELPKSMNLVQKDRLVLHCNASGDPKPEIKWYKGDELINSTHPRIKLQSDDNNMQNAKLIIEELDFEDRERYTCEAVNDFGSANTTIMVRVKDKLAALWPFLGICAEVAVLCAIIFVYEKKRVRPDFDESDTDQNTENKSVPDQREKGQEIRQRK